MDLKINLKHLYLLIVLVFVLLLSGCSGRYFRKASQAPPLSKPSHLFEQPEIEYWSRIVFNGAKIGFSHFHQAPSPAGKNRIDIHSEAYFRFRFLLIDKKANLKSYDLVAADLSLIRFDYSIGLDDSQMEVSGQLSGNQLTMTIHGGGEMVQQSILSASPVYPSSAILLYPLLHGLEVGRQYRYDVFDGQTQKIEPVEQEITAYEESELYAGPAFKIQTRFRGQTVTTWMDHRGLPLLEMSLGGIVISALESQKEALRYLTQAAFSKEETLRDFSLIKSDPLDHAPEELQSMTVAISGLTNSVDIPDDERQVCHREGNALICQISKFSLGRGADKTLLPGGESSYRRYLLPTFAISSEHPDVRRTAHEIAAGVPDDQQRLRTLIDWMQTHVKREAIDVFTALDVLKSRRAECQGHAMLFAAFARSLGIPTRIVNGIVYVPRLRGFLYHSWNESLLDGRWMAVDPIFSQLPADTTHVKLVEGDALSDLLPLVNMIGKLSVKILSASVGSSQTY